MLRKILAFLSAALLLFVMIGCEPDVDEGVELEEGGAIETELGDTEVEETEVEEAGE